ncbi:hypothetical protein [Autumnicola psychrophila]|uniref:Uncharacterized protein n=1 Tax=Autumnicola psychrophila TaxID=3075592 RepID=A0ABU3DWI1_9FLAO|nr:hypothetical protein [Zunongwangia sp. F225]MDT0688072.1 hypothetical protein [Zunongwangia sp. F225]
MKAAAATARMVTTKKPTDRIKIFRTYLIEIKAFESARLLSLF